MKTLVVADLIGVGVKILEGPDMKRGNHDSSTGSWNPIITPITDQSSSITGDDFGMSEHLTGLAGWWRIVVKEEERDGAAWENEISMERERSTNIGIGLSGCLRLVEAVFPLFIFLI